MLPKVNFRLISQYVVDTVEHEKVEFMKVLKVLLPHVASVHDISRVCFVLVQNCTVLYCICSFGREEEEQNRT